jgi:hypothetical protein
MSLFAPFSGAREPEAMTLNVNVPPDAARARRARANGGSMSEPKRRISLDWWTVLAALAAALLVKVGLLPAIPW